MASTTAPTSSVLLCFLTISLALLLLLLFRQLSKHSTVSTRKLPPGPTKIPIIGNLHQLSAVLPHLSLHNLSNKHGPFMFLQLGSIPTLVISSTDAVREVFPSHDIAFAGRPNLYAARKLSYGQRDIAFSSYGDYWRQSRKLAVTELLIVKRVQSFRAVREEEVDLLISSIRSISQSNSSPINLSEMLISLTNNLTSRVALGRKAGGEFNKILAETQNLLGGFCVSDFFPWLEWVHGLTGLRARLEKNFNELDRFFDQVIEEHISSNWPESENQDLVHVLVGLHKDPVHGTTFSSMNDVKGMLMDIFIAGTDTSSATLEWTIAELIRNPRVMNKLQKELRIVVGKKSKVDERDLQQFNYLKLVVKESLRLHPPGPLLLPRETTKLCRIQEYDIPAKTRVLINAKAISMDPKSWINPEEFWPERFLDNNMDFTGNDYLFMPFGIGRRICPGINYAKLVIELALANLLYCFNWRLPLGMEIEDLDFEEAIGITLHKKSPLYLLVEP